MLRLALLLVLCASVSVAQGRAERAVAAFGTWLDEQGLDGAFVVLDAGAVAGIAENGSTVDAPQEMASLSKAITAICAHVLVTEGALTWGKTPLGVLGEGPDVTLSDLVTHTGGIWPDGTQGLSGVARFLAHEDAAGVAMRIKERPLKPAAYRYNNENYALIALMIEAAVGTPYETACHARVLAPAGVSTARPSPVTGAMLPWGGWQMSVADYARFHAFWFGQKGALRAATNDLPSAKTGSSTFYGLGTLFAGSPPTRTFRHFGALCIPGHVRAGAYVETFGTGWTVVAAYDACPPGQTILALQRRLTNILGAP